jgi:flagellin-like hook-associated protein FlgL
MSGVTLSSAVRSNLLSLQGTADLMAQTQERLATGLKVNSALDNPTNFFNASALNSRANDLGRLLDGVSNATQTLEAADNGIEAITKLVESAQATARQAQQTSATVETTTAASAGTATGTGFSAVDMSGVTTGSGGTLIGGSTGTVDFSAANSVSFTVDDGSGAQTITLDAAAVTQWDANPANTDIADAANVTDAELAGLLQQELDDAGLAVTATVDSGAIRLTTDANGGTLTIGAVSGTQAGNTGFNDAGFASQSNTGTPDVSDDSFSFSLDIDNDGAQTITIDDAALDQYDAANPGSTIADRSAITATELAAVINQEIGDASFGTGISATASVTDSGQIQIASGSTGTSSEIEIASFNASGLSGGTVGLANGVNAGAAESTTETVNPERAEFISQYNEIVGQIDELAEDAGFNGVNLLNGDDLTVTFNEDGSSTLDITGVSFDSAGLGLSSLGTTAFDTDSSIDTVLGNLDTAISSLRSQASEFGSNLSIVETREDFTKSMINTLETGAANLTLADTNEEGANLLALQTRQSLSSTSLSLASQADQNVLRLL